MKLKMMVAVSALALSGAALAESYQAELNANAVRYDLDGLSSTENMYQLSGSYYFNAVNTSNLPLAEAAYLGQNSNVFAEFNDYPRQHGNPSQEFYRVGAEFYIPESFLYVKAGGSRYQSDGWHHHDWFTTLGVTPLEGLLVTTEYNHDAGYDANIYAKYVTDLGGNYVNLEAGVSDSEDGTITQLGGDFYIDNSFSVGAELQNQHSDNTYTLRTRKFFSDNFSGQLSYTDAPDGNIVMAGLTARF